MVQIKIPVLLSGLSIAVIGPGSESFPSLSETHGPQ